MLTVLVGAVGLWFFRRAASEPPLRLATGEPGGLYHKVGSAIEHSLERRESRKLSILKTHGSAQNFKALLSNQADLAIVQGGSVALERASIVTPLFLEFVFVIVRKDSSIQEVSDLAGRHVVLGPEGSGTRLSALEVLKHFSIRPDALLSNNLYFTALLEKPELEAAIVTAGIEHPQLRQVLATHQFRLLSIPSSAAIQMVHPFLRKVEIPQGLFAERPSVPPKRVSTIATTAYLVAQREAPDHLVEAALGAIHEESLRLRVPSLLRRQEAPKWVATKMHPVAQRYFHPADNIGLMANVMESLAAIKELLFALGAGIYLLWMRYKRTRERETEEQLHQQKEHLDDLLQETLRIERAQMSEQDPVKLRMYLQEVTNLKLTALHELTEEALRGDQVFSIFLDQCANLIGKIQRKLMTLQDKLS